MQMFEYFLYEMKEGPKVSLLTQTAKRDYIFTHLNGTELVL